MNAVFLIPLWLVFFLHSAQASQIQWKFDSEDSDAYRSRIRQFNESVITWRIDKFSRSFNLSNADLVHAVRTATDTWADVIPIDFRQSINASDEVDIIIRFLDNNYDNMTGHVLADGKLAECSYTKPVTIRFNGDVKFVIGNADNEDLFTVALHELGHALGLRGHSTVSNSLMAVGYNGRFTELTEDVVREIQALYGVRIGERRPHTTPSSKGPHNQSIPTSFPAPNATTAMSSANASRQCTPGRYYCGWQLQEMGYLVEGSIGHLYLCDNNSQGIYFTECHFDKCIISEAYGSQCYCPVGRKYCGHIFESQFNIKVPNWYAVYECGPIGKAPRLIKNCPDTRICKLSSCKGYNGRCNNNTSLYCGDEILRLGLASPSQKLELNALYYCNDTDKPFKRCSDGACQANGIGNSRCGWQVARKSV